MDLLTPALRAALAGNAATHAAAQRSGAPEPDPAPVVKLFHPLGPATWLATELDADGDTLFGLADLGFGCPELGAFSLSDIAALRLPYGLAIERDTAFASDEPLSRWADAARRSGSLIAAEAAIAAARPAPPHPLPPAGARRGPLRLPSSAPDGG